MVHFSDPDLSNSLMNMCIFFRDASQKPIVYKTIMTNDYEQSDGESEDEEEGGKGGEAKELTLLQIMERR